MNYTALYTAIEQNDIATIQLIINENKLSLTNAKHHAEGLSPLHFACQKGNVTITRMLLAQKTVASSVMDVDSQGNTALHLACAGGHLEIVQLFFENFSRKEKKFFNIFTKKEKTDYFDPNLLNKAMYSPFFLAARNGHVNVVDFLLAKDEININFMSNFSPLWAAFDGGHTNVVRSLLASKRFVINHPEDVLFFAANHNNLEIVKILWDDKRFELCKNQKDYDGRTVFASACYNKAYKVCEFLFDKKEVDINEPDNSGKTPFFLACEEIEGLWVSQGRLLEFLLKQESVNIHQPNNAGIPPLFIAHNSNMLLLLNNPRIDVNKTDNKGRTLFFYCCEINDSRKVLTLLERTDIDVNLANNQGQTPLQIAMEKKSHYIVLFLLADRRVITQQKTHDTILSLQNDSNANVYLKSIFLTTYRLFNPLPKVEDSRVEEGAAKLTAALIKQKAPVIAAQWYLLLILIAEGYLQPSESIQNHPTFNRFINISSKLSLEIQMLLCNHITGHKALFIRSKSITEALQCSTNLLDDFSFPLRPDPNNFTYKP